MMVGRFVINEVSRSIPAWMMRGMLFRTALIIPEMISGIALTIVTMI